MFLLVVYRQVVLVFFGFAGGTDTTVSWLDKEIIDVVVVAVVAAWPALPCLPISLYSNLGK